MLDGSAAGGGQVHSVWIRKFLTSLRKLSWCRTRRLFRNLDSNNYCAYINVVTLSFDSSMDAVNIAKYGVSLVEAEGIEWGSLWAFEDERRVISLRKANSREVDGCLVGRLRDLYLGPRFIHPFPHLFPRLEMRNVLSGEGH